MDEILKRKGFRQVSFQTESGADIVKLRQVIVYKEGFIVVTESGHLYTNVKLNEQNNESSEISEDTIQRGKIHKTDSVNSEEII